MKIIERLILRTAWGRSRAQAHLLAEARFPSRQVLEERTRKLQQTEPLFDEGAQLSK